MAEREPRSDGPACALRLGTEIVWLLLFVACATYGLTLLLDSVHDVAPFLDALTTSLSLAAQWLLNTKKIETWYFWIAADLIYVPLYGVKHLWLTAAVYVVFLAMCLRGFAEWRGLATASPVRNESVQAKLDLAQ